ncbi:alpha-L-rhamnosidase C-terminal domain-containing protein [Saccharicrinis sp. FJH54]|uniref:alpha-L-rhamnosidase C-terminal domain-containing protein n=1 Tax=Saccharicrinis sp. FJH54 TaxID=3344665 RepID=UPI0035D4E285
MNSFNHYAYGAIGEWLYTYVAGIRPDPEHPGYRHFFLSPHVGGGLTSATGSYKSMYGLIRSEWRNEENQFVYTIEIPANTTATVTLPHADLNQVKLNKRELTGSMRQSAVTASEGVTLKLGSGIYNFAYPAF